jgi:hypothetical protein
MDRFAIARSGSGVTVDTNTVFKADKDPAGWGAAVLKLEQA